MIICGGGTDVMAAVANGERSRDGLVVGVRPDATKAGASPDLSVTLVTSLGETRNAVIVWSADAVIVVGGWQVLDKDGRQVPRVEHVGTAEEAVELTLKHQGNG